MAIVAVSHWEGNYDQGLPIAREATPILKGVGTTSVRAGVCHSGPGPGLIYSEVTFPDWAPYGRVLENTEFRRVCAEFLKVAELRERAFIVGEEL